MCRSLYIARILRSTTSARILRAFGGLPYKQDMRKSIYSPEYRRVLAKLIELRTRAGLTQRDLATKLGREHSFVWRIESGQRRLDVVEFYWVCQALGYDAAVIYKALIKELAAPQMVAEVAKEEGLPLAKVAEPRAPYRTRPRKS